MLAELMRPQRPAMEFNIEGYPDDRLMRILRDNRPEQATLVPDAPDAFTSEEGWKLDPAQAALATTAIAAMQGAGLPRDPVHRSGPGGDRSGATGWAPTGWKSTPGIMPPPSGMAAISRSCAQIAATAERARTAGLVVNAGHDLNLHNIPPLMQAVPFLAEASIGHELTADALEWLRRNGCCLCGRTALIDTRPAGCVSVRPVDITGPQADCARLVTLT